MTISADGQEQVVHGTLSFPVACFRAVRDRCAILPHWHENFEVLTISEGSCTVCISTTKLHLTEGQGLFVNSGTLHAMPEFAECPGLFRSLVFSPRLIGGGLESVFWEKYVGPLSANTDLRAIVLDGSESWHSSATNAIERAWHACAYEPVGYEFAVREALSAVILDIALNTCTTPVPQSLRQSRSEQRVKHMMQFVHDNYTEDISLEDICAYAAVSQSEALRCFRETIGTTPMRYVKEYRLNKAASFLAETDLSAGEVAMKCGFSDAAYFSKSFRSWSGLPPSQYRKKYSGGMPLASLDQQP